MNRQFQQKTDRFWEFQEESNTWVEVKLPFDLVSCVDDTCSKVGSIHEMKKIDEDESQKEQQHGMVKERKGLKRKDLDVVLSVRKRISLTKMSDTSIWVTGESGSIYERFWNGVQWVIAPHGLPISAGHAVSVVTVNQTILTISEEGKLYQMRLNENSQPVWVEFMPVFYHGTYEEPELSSEIHIKSGVVSNDGMRVYFCTKSGLLLELVDVEPLSWENHGRPPGADVAAIADAAAIRTDVVYTISSSGDLYEYDKNSKPSWKKHIRKEGTVQDSSLIPLQGCTFHGLSGDHSVSLFLLTKGGKLIERRLHLRKWKWISHGSPEDHQLTSITPVLQDETNEKLSSLFATTSTGFVFEYRLSKQSGIDRENQISEPWLNHMHPPNTKVARGISGLKFQPGRILFPLDDGRPAELHVPGFGGESSGPTNQFNTRRKSANKYVWSILDAPETEGWNAEYCTEEHGPMNCIAGIKDELNDLGMPRPPSRRRKGNQEHSYLPPGTSNVSTVRSSEEFKVSENSVTANFRLRVMYEGRSFFLITDGGLTFEYVYTETVWLWLRHDHSTPMRGALGNYNGSIFLVNPHGSLLIRERSSNELAWINCTAMRKGRQVIGGPPWDGIPGKPMRATAEDALFFVSKSGKLLQFTVFLRKFKWKDCRNPQNTKVASIVDKELFRENIVFVIGRNGRLYQYNKVTELWHEHQQSQHLILSRSLGCAIRSTPLSLTGSLFMFSEDGRLVEYHWNAWDGWNWVEHGTPYMDVTLVGSPGPCFEGNQLFLIGSNGNVYLRYMEKSTWRWKNCGYPYIGKTEDRAPNWKEETCMDGDFAASLEKDAENVNYHDTNCNPKVGPTRPIPFSEDSVIFELKDGRLAEMRREEGMQWVWSRIIGTPTSPCLASYWTALAS